MAANETPTDNGAANKPAPENQIDRPKPEYVSSKPPIFYLYAFFQQRPVLLGSLAGVLGGLAVAGHTEMQVKLAVLGGAVIGTGLAALILRLRS